MQSLEFLDKCPKRTRIRERSSKCDTRNHIDWYDDCGSGHSQLNYNHIKKTLDKYVGKDANKAYTHLLKTYKNKADYNYGYFDLRQIFKGMMKNNKLKYWFGHYIDENNIIRKL